MPTRHRDAADQSARRPNRGPESGRSESVPWPGCAGVALNARSWWSGHGPDEAAIDAQERTGKNPSERIIEEGVWSRVMGRGKCAADGRRVTDQGRHDVDR